MTKKEMEEKIKKLEARIKKLEEDAEIEVRTMVVHLLENIWRLGKRDIEVVKCIVENPGLTAKQIGAKLNIGEETIEKTKARIKKLPFIKTDNYKEAAKKIADYLHLK